MPYIGHQQLATSTMLWLSYIHRTDFMDSDYFTVYCSCSKGNR